jgi:hypothetical protein
VPEVLPRPLDYQARLNRDSPNNRALDASVASAIVNVTDDRPGNIGSQRSPGATRAQSRAPLNVTSLPRGSVTTRIVSPAARPPTRDTSSPLEVCARNVVAGPTTSIVGHDGASPVTSTGIPAPITRLFVIPPGHVAVYVPFAADNHPSGPGTRSVRVDHASPCQYGSTASSRRIVDTGEVEEGLEAGELVEVGAVPVIGAHEHGEGHETFDVADLGEQGPGKAGDLTADDFAGWHVQALDAGAGDPRGGVPGEDVTCEGAEVQAAGVVEPWVGCDVAGAGWDGGARTGKDRHARPSERD